MGGLSIEDPYKCNRFTHTATVCNEPYVNIHTMRRSRSPWHYPTFRNQPEITQGFRGSKYNIKDLPISPVLQKPRFIALRGLRLIILGERGGMCQGDIIIVKRILFWQEKIKNFGYRVNHVTIRLPRCTEKLRLSTINYDASN